MSVGLFGMLVKVVLYVEFIKTSQVALMLFKAFK